MVSPTVIAVLLSIGFTIVATLIGLAYRNLLRRVRELEGNTNTQRGEHNSLSKKVDALWRHLFGVEDDAQDDGLSGEIQRGFDNIEAELQETQSCQEQYHTEEMDAITNLANELHDDPAVDIEREDVLTDD